jgi:ATP/ADP translocase
MTTQTLDLIKDIFFLLFFLVGTLWLWRKIKLPPNRQAYMEKLFERSRKRFKWMFLIGLLLMGGLFIWQYVLGK